MTAFSPDPEKQQAKTGTSDQTTPSDQPLGWEGHVHFPEESPLWSNLLRNWPELRSGLAFSLVFVVGALVGGSVASLILCNRRKSPSDHS